MPSKNAPVDPRLDAIAAGPARTAAARELADYDRRADTFRAELLPSGGLQVAGSRLPSGEWISPATPTLELLRRWEEWWAIATQTAERLAGVGDEHQAALLAVAGGLLSEAYRARTGILAAFASASFEPRLAAGPPVSEAGTVMVGDGVEILLTGAAVAGPKPKLPQIAMQITPGSDPQAVADYLRKIADRIEVTGSYT